MNDKPSVAVYKAIGIACAFVVSGTKKLVQQAYTQINLLIVSYALKTFRGEGEFAVNFFWIPLDTICNRNKQGVHIW
ncbi:hypothetical protein ACS86_10185 [Vibrio alginolyticus]|nr:hypothetical protein ACS86_10185 [Vibrio alginolyticus]